MPQRFVASFAVNYTRQNGEVVDVTSSPRKDYTCRDVVLTTMRNQIIPSFDDLLRGMLDRPGIHNFAYWKNNGYNTYAFKMWVRGNHQRIGLTMELIIADTFPMLSEFHIPRTIDRLRRKFPSVQFEVITESDAFSASTVYGIKLTGDMQVIPAFYWSGIILRLAQYDNNPEARPDRPWKDVNKLIERSDPNSSTIWSGSGLIPHANLWRAMTTEGYVTPGFECLANSCGPVTAHVNGYGTPGGVPNYGQVVTPYREKILELEF